jgi:cytochrome c peroxidase
MARLSRSFRPAALVGVLFGLGVLAVHAGATDEPGPKPGGLSRADAYRQAAGLTEIGRAMFSDPALSASGRMSCASCHDPAHAYGPTNALPVQPGGRNLEQAGTRAVPTLTYKQATPPFSEHFHDSDEEGDESIDAGPTGGLAWDGRVDRGREQALIPLLSGFEMANADRAALGRVIEARYGDQLRAVLGGTMASGPEAALDAGARALEVFQQDPAEFYPYSSKYDFVLAGRAKLSEQEARGLALFNDEAKGNCAACHISRQGADSSPPQFTDYGLIAIGVPRNPQIVTNQDPNFFDLGLCGPDRKDFAERAEYCGLFKTPTLRNVATRKTFFHNGAMRTLRDAVAFYVERDTRPERWYPVGPDGSPRIFDDLPARYHGNVNVEPPFDRKRGDEPALNAEEVDAVVAFLGTLTDRYKPE